MAGFLILNLSLITCFLIFSSNSLERTLYVSSSGNCTSSNLCTSENLPCDISCLFSENGKRFVLGRNIIQLESDINLTNVKFYEKSFQNNTLFRFPLPNNEFVFESFGSERFSMFGFPLLNTEEMGGGHSGSVFSIDARNVSLSFRNLYIHDLYPPGFTYFNRTNETEFRGSLISISEEGFAECVTLDHVTFKRSNMVFNSYVDDSPQNSDLADYREWNIRKIEILNECHFSELGSLIWLKLNSTNNITLRNSFFYDNNSPTGSYESRGALIHVWGEKPTNLKVEIFNSRFYNNHGIDNVFVDIFGSVTLVIHNSSFVDSRGSIIFLSGVNDETHCSSPRTEIDILGSAFTNLSQYHDKEMESVFRFEMTSPNPCTTYDVHIQNKFVMSFLDSNFTKNAFETHFSFEDNAERIHDMNTFLTIDGCLFEDNIGLEDFSSLIRFTKYTYSFKDHVELNITRSQFVANNFFDFLIFLYLPLKVDPLYAQNVIDISECYFANSINYFVSSLIKIYINGLLAVPEQYKNAKRRYQIADSHFHNNTGKRLITVSWTDIFGYKDNNEYETAHPVVIVKRTNFTFNKAEAIYCEDDLNIVVEHCIFEKNQIDVDQTDQLGSAIFIDRPFMGVCENMYPVEIRNSSFIMNEASFGAAFYIQNGYAIIENVYFRGNKASWGGSLFFYNSICKNKWPELRNLVFVHDNAEEGDSIYFQEKLANQNNLISLYNSTLSHFKGSSSNGYVATTAWKLEVKDKPDNDTEDNICVRFGKYENVSVSRCSLGLVSVIDLLGYKLDSSPFLGASIILRNELGFFLSKEMILSTDDVLQNGRITFFLSTRHFDIPGDINHLNYFESKSYEISLQLSGNTQIHKSYLKFKVHQFNYVDLFLAIVLPTLIFVILVGLVCYIVCCCCACLLFTNLYLWVSQVCCCCSVLIEDHNKRKREDIARGFSNFNVNDRVMRDFAERCRNLENDHTFERPEPLMTRTQARRNEDRYPVSVTGDALDAKTRDETMKEEIRRRYFFKGCINGEGMILFRAIDKHFYLIYKSDFEKGKMHGDGTGYHEHREKLKDLESTEEKMIGFDKKYRRVQSKYEEGKMVGVFTYFRTNHPNVPGSEAIPETIGRMENGMMVDICWTMVELPKVTLPIDSRLKDVKEWNDVEKKFSGDSDDFKYVYTKFGEINVPFESGAWKISFLKEGKWYGNINQTFSGSMKEDSLEGELCLVKYYPFSKLLKIDGSIDSLESEGEVTEGSPLLPKKSKKDLSFRDIKKEDEEKMWATNDIIKIINKNYKEHQEMVFKILRTPHPHIIRIFACTGLIENPDNEDFGYVFERCEFNLKYYLENILEEEKLSLPSTVTPESFAREKKLQILEEIAMGMEEIHRRGIIHNNLSPFSILLDCPRPNVHRVKIAGFDEACFVLPHGDEEMRKQKKDWRKIMKGMRTLLFNWNIGNLGLPFYKAPECIKVGGCCQQSDVYSYGILIYELFFGPYSDFNRVKKKSSHRRSESEETEVDRVSTDSGESSGNSSDGSHPQMAIFKSPQIGDPFNILGKGCNDRRCCGLRDSIKGGKRGLKTTCEQYALFMKSEHKFKEKQFGKCHVEIIFDKMIEDARCISEETKEDRWIADLMMKCLGVGNGKIEENMKSRLSFEKIVMILSKSNLHMKEEVEGEDEEEVEGED